MKTLTHGYAGEANDHLNRCQDDDCALDQQSFGNPVKRVERENEAEEVLEDDHHGERFDRQVT